MADAEQEWTMVADDEQRDDFRRHIGIAVAIIVVAGILTAVMEITAGNW